MDVPVDAGSVLRHAVRRLGERYTLWQSLPTRGSGSSRLQAGSLTYKTITFAMMSIRTVIVLETAVANICTTRKTFLDYDDLKSQASELFCVLNFSSVLLSFLHGETRLEEIADADGKTELIVKVIHAVQKALFL